MTQGPAEVGRVIDAAFKVGVPSSSSALIRSASLEAQQVRDFFAGKRWSDITLKSLQEDYVGDGGACLWFMTPAAVAYYLPAYLKMVAFEYYEADAIAAELVIKLRRAAEGEESNLAEGIAMLNRQQNEAIARVLALVATGYEATGVVQDASIALKRRWGSYLDAS